MPIITKTQPAYIEHYPYRVVTSSGTYSGSASLQEGLNRIEYSDGPKYIRLGNKQQCNWKYCHHYRSDHYSGITGSFSLDYDSYDGRVSDHRMAYGVPMVPLSWNFWPTGAYPPIPEADLDQLFTEVYTDLMGRTKDNLLVLEDLAGFVSGKSLWTGVKGVAAAINGLAKSISNGRKLMKHFGAKHSLYDMWLSSKETVRQIIGLRLGYRFSFKTTLNDFAQAVDFGYGFGQYVAQINKRNSSEFLLYSKTINKSDIARKEVVGWSSMKSNFLYYASGVSFAKDVPRDVYDASPIVRKVESGVQAKAFVKARVRYPAEYSTLKHYLENRFGLDKPLTTLWAIVPLSFLVDYLLNVQESLTYLDNKLNDYLVSTNISQAWLSKKSFRRKTVEVPSLSWVTPHYSYDGGPIMHKWGGGRSVVETSLEYERMPVGSSRLLAQWPPIISATESNWVRSVGTGLELLSQTRLR